MFSRNSGLYKISSRFNIGLEKNVNTLQYFIYTFLQGC